VGERAETGHDKPTQETLTPSYSWAIFHIGNVVQHLQGPIGHNLSLVPYFDRKAMTIESEPVVQIRTTNECMTEEDIEFRLRTIEESCENCPRLQAIARRAERATKRKSRVRGPSHDRGPSRSRRSARGRRIRSRDLDPLYLDSEVEMLA